MNKMTLKVSALSVNESFVRTAVAAFMISADPSLEQINDVKTAVSEAVTNAIVHAYPDGDGEIVVECELDKKYIKIVVSDTGVGIEDIKQATKPFFTTGISEERAGLGFTVMRSFMDELEVDSERGVGTTVSMIKRIA